MQHWYNWLTEGRYSRLDRIMEFYLFVLITVGLSVVTCFALYALYLLFTGELG